MAPMVHHRSPELLRVKSGGFAPARVLFLVHMLLFSNPTTCVHFFGERAIRQPATSRQTESAIPRCSDCRRKSLHGQSIFVCPAATELQCRQRSVAITPRKTRMTA